MSKVIIRAQYDTEDIFCDGYICIDGNCIEGIFGIDYVKIDIIENSIHLLLHEKIYTNKGDSLFNYTRSRTFISQTLYSSKLYCPESYILFYQDYGMSLSLIETVKDSWKVNEIFKELSKIRP